MLLIKNNKKIADYMGGQTYKTAPTLVRGSRNIWLPVHGVCRWDTVELGKGKTLRYHNSWDWLIPVIDKIKSDDIYPKYVDYSSSMLDEGGVYINTKFINVTYDNVIDFINWYNEQ